MPQELHCTVYARMDNEQHMLFVRDGSVFPFSHCNRKNWRIVASGLIAPFSAHVDLMARGFFEERKKKMPAD